MTCYCSQVRKRRQGSITGGAENRTGMCIKGEYSREWNTPLVLMNWISKENMSVIHYDANMIHLSVTMETDANPKKLV